MSAPRQDSLFDAPAERPPGWRAPTDPREHPCRICAGVGIFGLGEAWFCLAHRPHGFMPHERGGA